MLRLRLKVVSGFNRFAHTLVGQINDINGICSLRDDGYVEAIKGSGT